jgi:hypothetical protein
MGFTPKGKPAAERPVQWCKDKLGLEPSQRRGPLKNKFVINKKTPLSDFANPQHVVITIEGNEDGWKDGFYYSSSLRIENVKKLLEPN